MRACRLLSWSLTAEPRQHKQDIVHDAEYYILEAQNGERWKAEDEQLQKRLAELREKYGTPPNIVHIMWDDTAYGDVGIPAIQKVRGFEDAQPERDGEAGNPLLSLLHRGGLHS